MEGKAEGAPGWTVQDGFCAAQQAATFPEKGKSGDDRDGGRVGKGGEDDEGAVKSTSFALGGWSLKCL